MVIYKRDRDFRDLVLQPNPDGAGLELHSSYYLSKISWDSLENTSGTKEVAFLEILNDHFLTQLNFIPTRRDRVLDLVITNVPDRVRVR